VTSTDFLPTVMQMQGGRGQTEDGVSLVPLLKGGTTAARDVIYWHYPHYSNQDGVPGGAVRRLEADRILRRHRLELYNVKHESGERTNLARREARLTGSLRTALDKWRGFVNAVMPKENPLYDAATADQGPTGAEPKTDPV
jgi:hypothetical protein